MIWYDLFRWDMVWCGMTYMHIIYTSFVLGSDGLVGIGAARPLVKAICEKVLHGMVMAGFLQEESQVRYPLTSMHTWNYS